MTLWERSYSVKWKLQDYIINKNSNIPRDEIETISHNQLFIDDIVLIWQRVIFGDIVNFTTNKK